MSNCDTQDRSTLEKLPDELFFEIFEYLSVSDLYTVLGNLNKRFARIVHSLSNLSAVWTTKFDDRMIGRFASRITQLTVWRGCHLNLSRFSKLRSMEIVLPSTTQCHELQSSTLEHLYIERSLRETGAVHQFCALLFTNAFPRLRTCRIEEMMVEHANVACTSPLRSLTTRTKDPVRLLMAFPLLIHLRLNLTENATPNPSSIPHLKLRHLELLIYSKEITQSTIESILTLLPNITRFTLDVRCGFGEGIDDSIRSFAVVLIRCLPQLRTLRMSFLPNSGYFNDIQTDDWKKSIEQLHPLFQQITLHAQSSRELARVVISSRTES